MKTRKPRLNKAGATDARDRMREAIRTGDGARLNTAIEQWLRGAAIQEKPGRVLDKRKT